MKRFKNILKRINDQKRKHGNYKTQLGAIYIFKNNPIYENILEAS